jgi:hypothetical protein
LIKRSKSGNGFSSFLYSISSQSIYYSEEAWCEFSREGDYQYARAATTYNDFMAMCRSVVESPNTDTHLYGARSMKHLGGKTPSLDVSAYDGPAGHDDSSRHCQASCHLWYGDKFYDSVVPWVDLGPTDYREGNRFDGHYLLNGDIFEFKCLTSYDLLSFFLKMGSAALSTVVFGTSLFEQLPRFQHVLCRAGVTGEFVVYLTGFKIVQDGHLWDITRCYPYVDANVYVRSLDVDDFMHFLDGFGEPSPYQPFPAYRLELPSPLEATDEPIVLTKSGFEYPVPVMDFNLFDMDMREWSTDGPDADVSSESDFIDYGIFDSESTVSEVDLLSERAAAVRFEGDYQCHISGKETSEWPLSLEVEDVDFAPISERGGIDPKVVVLLSNLFGQRIIELVPHFVEQCLIRRTYKNLAFKYRGVFVRGWKVSSSDLMLGAFYFWLSQHLPPTYMSLQYDKDADYVDRALMLFRNIIGWTRIHDLARVEPYISSLYVSQFLRAVYSYKLPGLLRPVFNMGLVNDDPVYRSGVRMRRRSIKPSVVSIDIAKKHGVLQKTERHFMN